MLHYPIDGPPESTAKRAAAERGIAFARRGSRTSCSSSANRAASVVVVHGAAIVDLSALDPAAQRLGVDSELVGDAPTCTARRARILLRVEHEPDRTLAKLLAVPPWCCHASHPLWVETLDVTRDGAPTCGKDAEQRSTSPVPARSAIGPPTLTPTIWSVSTCPRVPTSMNHQPCLAAITEELNERPRAILVPPHAKRSRSSFLPICLNAARLSRQ